TSEIDGDAPRGTPNRQADRGRGPKAERIGPSSAPGPRCGPLPFNARRKAMRGRGLVGFAVVLALGCGGPKKFAPVSGTVTMDGKPLAGATVTFIPVPDPGSIEAGDGSVGKTNEKGEYTLMSSKGRSGAQVGKHKVSISIQETKRGESEERERT